MSREMRATSPVALLALCLLALCLLTLSGAGCGDATATSDADASAHDGTLDSSREASLDGQPDGDRDGDALAPDADARLDMPTADAAAETASDAASDAAAESAGDTASDSVAETTSDAGIDTDDAASDGSIADATSDAATDATSDAAADATSETTSDSAADSAVDAASDSSIDTSSDSAAPIVDGGCPSSGVATIGATGGVLWSSDCAARLVLPAGALSSTQLLTMSASSVGPPGSVAPAYDIGPNGLTLNSPATLTLSYSTNALKGATEQALIAGTVDANLWDPLTGSSVNTTARHVDAPLTKLGTVSVLPGDASGPVANVLVLASAATSTRFVAAGGGETPVIGVPINASSFPLAGKTLAYSSANPTVASINSVTGQLLGGVLTQANAAESVPVTAVEGVSGVSGTSPVLVLPRPTPEVSEQGTFTALDASGVFNGTVTVTYLQNPTKNFTFSGGGFAQLLALPAGSFYTLRFVAPGYLPTDHSWWSQISSTSTAQRAYLLLRQQDLSNVACATTVDITSKGAIVIPAAPATPKAGWTYSVSDPAATVRYAGVGFSASCSSDVSTSVGSGVVLNVAPGTHWVVAKRGTEVYAVIVRVEAGAVAQALFPSLASKDGTSIF